MKRIALLTLVAAGFAVASTALASSAVTTVAGVGVSGGSEIRLSARSTPAGVDGRLWIGVGRDFFDLVEVRCVRLVSDGVLVGGEIVDSTTPVVVGRTAMVKVQDAGPSGDDRVSITFSTSGLDACPVFENPVAPLESGQFVVTVKADE